MGVLLATIPPPLVNFDTFLFPVLVAGADLSLSGDVFWSTIWDTHGLSRMASRIF